MRTASGGATSRDVFRLATLCSFRRLVLPPKGGSHMVLSPRSGFEDTCSVARPRWHEINNNEMHQVELVQQRNVIIRLHDAKRMEIRRAAESDFEAMWPIFRDVVASGDTYVFSPDTSRDDAFAFWFGPGVASYVAEAEGRIVGMY